MILWLMNMGFAGGDGGGGAAGGKMARSPRLIGRASR